MHRECSCERGRAHPTSAPGREPMAQAATADAARLRDDAEGGAAVTHAGERRSSTSHHGGARDRRNRSTRWSWPRPHAGQCRAAGAAGISTMIATATLAPSTDMLEEWGAV